MKLFQDLEYAGVDGELNLYENIPWHCTSFVTEFSTNEKKFCVQQPYYHNGVFMGYAGLDIYLFTEDELIENFKIIKEDGSLEDIKHSKDNEKLQQMIKEIDNMTDEEFEKLIG